MIPPPHTHGVERREKGMVRKRGWHNKNLMISPEFISCSFQSEVQMNASVLDAAGGGRRRLLIGPGDVFSGHPPELLYGGFFISFCLLCLSAALHASSYARRCTLISFLLAH